MFTALCIKTSSHLYMNIGLRTLRTCSALQSSNREGKVMMKVMNLKKSNKRNFWYKDSYHKGNMIEASKASLGMTGGGKVNLRRRTVLNKLFMSHITDQMSSGEMQGRGIQITKVQVSPDINVVNVFWLCDNSMPASLQLSTDLHQYSIALRHKLSQLRLVGGSVPPIRFLPDRQRYLGVQVDKLLKDADFGQEEDFPENANKPGDWLKLETLSQEPLLEGDDPLPIMRNNVLGVEQADIIAKVKRTLKKVNSSQNAPEIADQTLDVESNVDTVSAEIAAFKQQKPLTRKLKPQCKKTAWYEDDSRWNPTDSLEDDYDFDDGDFEDTLESETK